MPCTVSIADGQLVMYFPHDEPAEVSKAVTSWMANSTPSVYVLKSGETPGAPTQDTFTEIIHWRAVGTVRISVWCQPHPQKSMLFAMSDFVLTKTAGKYETRMIQAPPKEALARMELLVFDPKPPKKQSRDVDDAAEQAVD